MYYKINPRWVEDRKLWRVSIQKNGVRKTFSSAVPRSEGKKIVRQKAIEWLENGDNDKNERFSIVYPRFLQFYYEKSGNNTSYRRYISFGNNHLLPVLGKYPVGSITLDQWQNCITNATPKDGRTKALSKKTLGAIRECISAFMKWAKPRKYIDEDLSSELFIPKTAAIKGKDILQLADVERWFQEPTGLWYEKALMFQLLIGCRPGECLGLQRNDYDPRKHIITIRRSINNRGEITPGKNKNARRTIELTGTPLRLLEEQLERTKDLRSDWIFCGKLGQKPSPRKYYQTMTRIAEARDLPKISPYCLRHTFLSLVEGYLPQRAMKAIVGHSEATDTHALYGEHEVDGELQLISRSLKVTPLYQTLSKIE